VLCQHGDRRVSRREADGTMVPLATNFDGRKLNSPNDLVFDRRAISTSPIHRMACPALSGSDQGTAIPGCVPRRQDGKVTLLTKELEAPNGLAFSPDYKTLYVANSQKRMPIWKAFPSTRWKPRREPRVRRLPQLVQGRRRRSRWHEGRREWQRVRHRSWGCVDYTPDGTLLGRILTGVPTANVAWGETAPRSS
jgi:gluconolactonase